MPEESVRVFIVDDHPIVREGISQLVNGEKDLTVCGVAGDIPSALDGIRDAHPHVVMVDLSLEGASGLQLVKDIKSRYKKMAVLVVSMYDERIYAERALGAGADGYIMKQEATKDLISAIRRVSAGKVAVSEDVAERLTMRQIGGQFRPAASPLEALTDRELEVLRLIGQGYKTRDIGDQLNLSVKTIETHRENIKLKLNLEDASELTRYAIAWMHEQ